MFPPKIPGYDLEFDKMIVRIQKEKAKTVCLQVVDGLKPFAPAIAQYLEAETKAKVVVWLDTNWGSCDYPAFLKGIDLLINVGHTSAAELMPNPE
ncbi:MAG: diphthamide synthesis protein [Nanoarchaeota archaeon]|nr:diphthamide synthesis protein [Nanoarchaeota archaeon]